MSRAIRIGIIAVAALPAVALCGSAVFAMDRASNGGEILGGVAVGGVELSGLSETQARRALQELEADMSSNPLTFDVQGTRFQLLPSEIGFDLDDEALLSTALGNGREGGLGAQFRWWASHLFDRGALNIEPTGTWDRAALRGYLDQWETSAIADPPFDGGVAVEDGRVVALNPETGTGIDQEAVLALVDEAIFAVGSRQAIVVPTSVQSPALTEADVAVAVARAGALLRGPVVLSRLNPNVQVNFGRQVLASALRSEVVGLPDQPEIRLYFDPEPLMQYLEPQRAEIEFAPVDAQVVIRPDDVPTIIRSRPALLIDEESLPEVLLAAAASGSRAGPFPYREGDPPQFSTEDAEALGIKGLISYHDGDVCCTTFYTPGGDEKNQNRVHNIQLMADTVNGTIVMPGETFSLNGLVGQRTLEKGYRLAGAIIGPIVDCCDDPANVGGGVSQFTTTLYNAVFWSGLEDVDHTPHTLYISRYPEGIEATLGWPSPDLQFRNNTDAAVYIKTEHTDDSITVKLFGDNGGIQVAAERSERTNFTSPEDYYEADESVPPGEEEVTDEGSPGWTVTVYRIIHYPDGTETTESWIWRYHPWPKRISVHPCELPPDHEDYVAVCPSEVPDLTGVRLPRATELLAARDLLIALGDSWLVTDADQVDRVQAQSPAAGTWLQPGEVVTVRLGVLADSGGDG
jgi:vancomycin resistance protein YoaR